MRLACHWDAASTRPCCLAATSTNVSYVPMAKPKPVNLYNFCTASEHRCVFLSIYYQCRHAENRTVRTQCLTLTVATSYPRVVRVAVSVKTLGVPLPAFGRPVPVGCLVGRGTETVGG